MDNFAGISIPDEMKKDVRMELVKLHAAVLEHRGTSYGRKLADTDLTQEERILISFFASGIALHNNHFDKLPELYGFTLYGFLIYNLNTAAKQLVELVMKPESGGTAVVCLHLLWNLKLLSLSKEYWGLKVETKDMIEELQGIITEHMSKNIHELMQADRTFARVTSTARAEEVVRSIEVTALWIIGVLAMGFLFSRLIPSGILPF